MQLRIISVKTRLDSSNYSALPDEVKIYNYNILLTKQSRYVPNIFTNIICWRWKSPLTETYRIIWKSSNLSRKNILQDPTLNFDETHAIVCG